MSFTQESKVLITGITSIHGWPIYQSLIKEIKPDNIIAIVPPKAKIKIQNGIISSCITDEDVLQKIKDNFNPTHVIHCAGVCDLDVCEDRPNWAWRLNVGGAKNIVKIFGETSKIIYYSSDLVYSGNNPPEGGYAEHHEADPVSIAGKTVLESESIIKTAKNHCIVRVALPLGDSIYGDKGAVDWIEGRFKKGRPVTLFYDELRSCIECVTIGKIALQILKQDLNGLFHMGDKKPWTLYEIGEYVLKKGNYPKELLTGIYKKEEKNGPPRIGDVSMNSEKLNDILSYYK